MKKDIKIYLIIAIIIAIIIIGIYFLKKNPNNNVSEETVKCLAEKSELYIQLGCKYCKIQEDMFEENYIYLNVIDCAYQPEKCAEAQITGTPTWIINGEKYPGAQSIKKLKELTGC